MPSSRRSAITTIGFDADDTLWENEKFFRLTEDRFVSLLSDLAEAETLPSELLEAERRNVGLYGFGIKGFTLSMIETAIAVTGAAVPAAVIGEILAAGREMLSHPIETLPQARPTLEELARSYRLVLITKGDLFDQERKLAESGLGDFFDGVEIVSGKSAATYRDIFSRHGEGPQTGLMVGNSLKSDILPAIEAGSFAVHVPHELTWAMEHAEAPSDSARFRQIADLGELPTLLADLA